MTPISRRIAEIIRERNWTQAETAKRLGISAQHMSDVLHGKRRISPRLAVRMERVLGVDAGSVLHNQLDEDLRKARKENS